MEKEDFIGLFLPEFVLENFDAVSYSVTVDAINIYLDEKAIKPNTKEKFISKGFTPATKVQDFPARGKAVLLHIRRRKWLNTESNKITTRAYELSHYGTDLSEEFVAFLKGKNRIFSN
ncbi:MAG: transposase family protein [Rikenellaceae bacterium]